jgi:nucleotide-binding universal stress UspA family protein
MYQHIMVPLDGSKLAESAVPYAEELAKGCRAKEITFLHVTEQAKGYRRAKGRLETEPVSKKEREAEGYLSSVAKGVEAKGIKTRTKSVLGNPAEQIAFYAEHDDCDMIVMSSHGRSGPSRWAHGSVADKVFKASCIPVLMVRAPGCVTGV